jgi:VanZ family protein
VAAAEGKDMPFIRLRRRIFLVWVLVMAPLLFLGGPDYYSPRSVSLSWQLGHPLLFFMLVTLGLEAFAALGKRPWLQLLGLALLLTLLVGGAIEWLQQFVGRQSSWGDVRLDLLGAAVAVAWAGLRQARRGVWMPRAVLVGALLTLVIMDLRSLAVALVDEHRMRRSFPVLADFSTPFELERWASTFPHSVVPAPDGSAGHVMKVALRPAPYAGFSLRYFEGDWRGFGRLAIRVFNAQPEALDLTCRINDRQHETDNRFADRYNGRFVLVPGWNNLEVPLATVRAAPAGREMDMGRITGVGCFVAGLREGVEVWVGGVELELAAPRGS